ncbi:hypothetical protein Dimus_017544 [Dionaea muscipula]
MAKRGRPRKRGGLARVEVSPRVALNSRVSSRVAAREDGVEIESASSADKLKGVQMEEVDGVCDLSGSADSKIGRKVILPIELWGDEEGELVENQVTMEAARGLPYLSALQRSPEDSVPDLTCLPLF